MTKTYLQLFEEQHSLDSIKQLSISMWFDLGLQALELNLRSQPASLHAEYLSKPSGSSKLDMMADYIKVYTHINTR